MRVKDALAQNVAFMPGEPFFPDRAQASTSMRLNFSHVAPEAAARGLSTLANLVRKRLG